MSRVLALFSLIALVLLLPDVSELIARTDHPSNKIERWSTRSEDHGAAFDRVLHRDGSIHTLFRDAGYDSGRFDLSRGLPVLFRVYRTHTDERIRFLAAAAIQAVGNPWAIRHLRDYRTCERSNYLRACMLAIPSGR